MKAHPVKDKVWYGMGQSQRRRSLVFKGTSNPPLPNVMLVPSSPSRKGKEKAVYEDVEMADGGSSRAALKPVPTGRFDFFNPYLQIISPVTQFRCLAFLVDGIYNC